MALTYKSVDQHFCGTKCFKHFLSFLTHLSVGPQNGVTHGIFSAGEDSSQALEIHDVGSNARDHS